MIKIAGGKWKGQVLATPKGQENTRPTSARLRESIFNSLVNGMGRQFAHVLDIFAGTGALGIEALSHGAETAVFIESDTKTLESLEKNIVKLVAPNATAIIKSADMKRWEKRLLDENGRIPFDLIFCDPPYGKQLATKAMEHLQSPLLWASDAILVVEISKMEILEIPRWHIFKDSTMGDTKVVFLKPAH